MMFVNVRSQKKTAREIKNKKKIEETKKIKGKNGEGEEVNKSN